MSNEQNPQVRRPDDWDNQTLRELATAHGTPLYVIDLDRIRENAQRFQAAFPTSEVYYAAKANTSRAVLAVIGEETTGVECASAGEIERARTADISPDQINYTAVNPPQGDLEYAASMASITITAGAVDTIDRLADLGFDGKVSIRINPEVGAGHHDHVTTGTNPKFGIPYDRAVEVLEDVHDRAFDLVGIHAHAGSGITSDDASTYREFLSRIRSVVGELSFELEFIDIGGGFGVPYHPDDEPIDLDRIAGIVQEIMGDVSATIVLEPGRYIVADAGMLLTEVNTIKETKESTVIGVDAGMNTLIRPALYDAYHHIVSLEPDRDTDPETVMITGPICESADVFGENRVVPRPQRGDILGIGTTGAYGFEMASNYNSRPRPAVAAIEDQKARIIRERETVSDLIRGELE